MTTSLRYDLAALILRISLGVMLIAHGLLKVFVFTMPGTVQFFDSVGLAGWMAYPVVLLEVGGGILILAGIASRWISIAVIPVLIGALVVHSGNGWLFTNANGGWEYPAFLTMAAIALAILGDGRFSLKLPARSVTHKLATN